MKNKYFTVVIALFFTIFGSRVEAQIDFTATVDKKKIAVGEPFELKFSLKNANGSRFVAPTLSADFDLLSGPSRMNAMSIINGVSTSSESYTFVLRPKREGSFTIGSASIIADKKTLQSPPLSIEVTKGRSTVAPDLRNVREDVFVRAEPSTTTAYIGGQILLDFKIYTRLNLSGQSFGDEPKFEGFYKQDIEQFPHTDEQIKVNGKTYLTRVLKRVALFPQVEGTFTLDPMTMQVGAVTQAKEFDPFENPFGAMMSDVQIRTISTPPLSITVKKLPETSNIPTFSGGVGSFQALFSMPQTMATTDEALSLRLKIVGNGDAKRWNAPNLESNDSSYTIYPPRLISEQAHENGGELETVKEFEYQIVPKQAGAVQINPAFTFFNADKNDFQTISQSFSVNIVQGTGKIATVSADDPIEGETDSFFSLKNATLLLAFLALIFVLYRFSKLFLAGLSSVKMPKKEEKTQQMPQNITEKPIFVPEIKIETPQNTPPQYEAHKRWQTAEKYANEGNYTAFFDELSRVLQNVVIEKTGLQRAEFTREKAAEYLQNMQIADNTIAEWLNLLQRCDLALFAKSTADAIYLQPILTEAVLIVNKIEKKA